MCYKGVLTTNNPYPRAMILLIDNYDSFTYNLVHLLGDIGLETRVERNDALSAKEALALEPRAIILSPGPKDPDHAGICLELVRESKGRVPFFGVCLGYQVIAQAFGAKIIRGPEPVHGKVNVIQHNGGGIFENIEDEFESTRYHSLIVDPESIPPQLEVTAHNQDGILMALRHKEFPLFGVQFHPESIAAQHGQQILANFIALAGIKAHAPA